MRKFIGCILGICLAVSAQAVTVKWTVPSGDWTSEASVYFVYSASDTKVTDYEALYNATKDLSNGGTSGNYTRFSAGLLGDDDGTWTVTGGSQSLTASTTGYYYLMVFKNSESSLYAVGGAKQYDAEGTNGIYAQTVEGKEPDSSTYVDMGGFIGGTWTAAIVPEPTLLSLLAFGVAGLALRRKSHC